MFAPKYSGFKTPSVIHKKVLFTEYPIYGLEMVVLLCALCITHIVNTITFFLYKSFPFSLSYHTEPNLLTYLKKKVFIKRLILLFKGYK